jgi:CDGSH iron-sulfur domain-containing protein 1
MARLVRHEASAPIKIDPAHWPRDEQGNPRVISICACGLSAKFPFCDGSHKRCRDEVPGAVQPPPDAQGQPRP